MTRAPRPDVKEAVEGIYLFGVLRCGAARPAVVRGEDPSLRCVRYRELEALVRPVPFGVPPLDHWALVVHQRTVERAMRRGTIVPAPYGLVFRTRRALVTFLHDQYPALDEALAFLEGHWELRLHVSRSGPGEPTPELVDLALHAYTELRRFARAAVPFPREGRKLLSAAFLVERGDWVGFVERADDLGATTPELTFDVTGPWPPYDFVKMVL